MVVRPMMPSTMPIHLAAFAILVAAAVPSPTATQGATSQSGESYYCGKNWPHAAAQCGRPCPSGDDSECEDGFPGKEYKRFGYTGCEANNAIEEETNEGGLGDGVDSSGGGDSQDGSTTEGAIDNYCGPSWLSAMRTCQSTCPLGTECTAPGEKCYAATGCHRELVALSAPVVVSMAGPDRAMDGAEMDILQDVLKETVAGDAEGMGIYCGGADVEEQSLVFGRRARNRRRRAVTALATFDYHVRKVSVFDGAPRIGSSALDVSVVVSGEYRPPPYVEWGELTVDSINRNSDTVVTSLRERGQRAGREYFERVESLVAVRAEEKTERPTRSPVQSPTWSPIGPPTGFPSAMPTYAPSVYPSTAPSRAHHQVLTSGSETASLQLGGNITSSFGLVFNMRIKPDAGVVLVTGFDFYVESPDEVTFELWTRLGSFEGHRGSYEGWDMIAGGTLRGEDVGLVSIPEDLYTPVAIPGGGGEAGTRAFYLTLQSMDLVYMLGDEEDGASDAHVHAETQELEVWEGEAVLLYPFPDPEIKFLYRAPRQYLGVIHYDRLPCKPFSLYGPVDDYPCPEVPTGSPTEPLPTKAPSVRPTASPSHSPVVGLTKLPSQSPTLSPIRSETTPAPIEPTEYPTASPTSSAAPMAQPTTGEPTMAPVVPMRAYIVTTLRNVLERDLTTTEAEKYVAILTEFLRRHTERSMVLDGIEMWHQALIMVDVEEEMVVEDAKRILPPTMKEKPPAMPQIAAMEVQLILKVSASNLPVELLGKMASAIIDEHEEELLGLLRAQQAFYTFFKLVDGVESRTILEVTNPPSQAPTTTAYWEAMQAALDADALGEETEEATSRMGFGVFVGLGIGFLWCILTGVSVAYLLGARNKMEEEHDMDMEHLLEAEKADPLNNDSVHDRDAAPNIVVRSNNLDDPELWDQTDNAHLSASARAMLSKHHHENELQLKKGTRSRSLTLPKTDSSPLHSDRGQTLTRNGREQGKLSKSMPRLKHHSMGSKTTESSTKAHAKRLMKRTRSRSLGTLELQKSGPRHSARKGGVQDKHHTGTKEAKEPNEDVHRVTKRKMSKSLTTPTSDPSALYSETAQKRSGKHGGRARAA